MKSPDFFIVYSPGSGGNFLDNIFRFYADKSYYLNVDPITGCVKKTIDGGICSRHFSPDQLHEFRKTNPTTKIIGIVFGSQDIDLIANMHYAKYDEPWLTAPGSKENATQQWPLLVDKLFDSDVNVRKPAWIGVLTRGLKHWIETFEATSVDLTISIDTLLGRDSKDLNSIVASVFKKNPDPALNSYIVQWQSLAKQYY